MQTRMTYALIAWYRRSLLVVPRAATTGGPLNPPFQVVAVCSPG